MRGNKVATRLYRYATPVPIPIKVNMFGLRFTRDVQNRWKKGQPAHSTAGVASASSIHGSHPFGSARCTGMLGSMSAIAIPSKGTVKQHTYQERRVMSRSSGFSSSRAVTVRGSSAIPQIAQLPGCGRTISGCMGQVYSTRATAGVLGSRAIPQLGHDPGLVSRTSRHMGQT